MKVISERVVVIAFYIYVFYYYHWVDTSAGGLLVPDGIIRPVGSASALTLFSRYIVDQNLQFLKHELIIKIKVLLPQEYVFLPDFCYPV
jgi:hypothetical protein